nr:immunoglobulin heavy chain junction region [Macaca mulatta]MOX64910.1 immunoglobulin heavy chain junction region [Macaca mulatta]MOX67417.1 immunoglobulin heavy chain junction region [Macaca mulatta]
CARGPGCTNSDCNGEAFDFW